MKTQHPIMQVLENNNLISDFPTEYLDILVKAYDKAFNIFGNNILSITLGGSGGKNHIHEGWSDLDLYFVLIEYDIRAIALYNDSFNKNNEIHLGTTFYSLKEVEKGMLNVKTKVMIYEKYKYLLNPTLFGNDYFLPVNYETIRLNDINNLPNILHECKRMILDLKNDRVEANKYHVKKMLILLKCLLNYHNIFSFGYEEVILKFTRLCSDFNFSLSKQSGLDIITLIDDYENIKNYKEEIIKFSEEIFEFIYKFC